MYQYVSKLFKLIVRCD